MMRVPYSMKRYGWIRLRNAYRFKRISQKVICRSLLSGQQGLSAPELSILFPNWLPSAGSMISGSMSMEHMEL